MRRFALLFATALVPAPAAADGGRLPAFAFVGPYGDPFTLAAKPGFALPSRPASPAADRIAGEAGARTLSARAAGSAGTIGGDRKREDEDDDDDDDDPVPAKPGTFPTTFMKVPDPVPTVKNRSMGPHLKPDAEFSLDDRTTLGIIGQLDRLHTSASQVTLGRSATPGVSARSVTGTTAHGRDLGLGASLEFKLGQ